MFLADLMEIYFGESDLILGMDFLSEQRVSLDCDTKWVTLRTPNGSEIIMISKIWNYLSNAISAFVADNMIREGCEAPLVYILDTKVDGLVSENILGVKEFPSVFP